MGRRKRQTRNLSFSDIEEDTHPRYSLRNGNRYDPLTALVASQYHPTTSVALRNNDNYHVNDPFVNESPHNRLVTRPRKHTEDSFHRDPKFSPYPRDPLDRHYRLKQKLVKAIDRMKEDIEELWPEEEGRRQSVMDWQFENEVVIPQAVDCVYSYGEKDMEIGEREKAEGRAKDWGEVNVLVGRKRVAGDGGGGVGLVRGAGEKSILGNGMLMTPPRGGGVKGGMVMRDVESSPEWVGSV